MHADTTAHNTEAGNDQATVQPALRWAVIDLMGHNFIAGAVSNELIGGVALLRVDVPEVTTHDAHIPAHARSFTSAAVFAIAWCDEAAALAAAQLILHTPPTSTNPEAGHARKS